MPRRRPIATLALLIALPLAVRGQSRRPAAPSPARRVVDAFSGRWILTGSYTESSSASPVRLTVTIQYEPALLGNAVICRTASDDSRGGHTEIACIIGYSPDDQRIHLMEVSSSGSYHEHKGTWVGDEIRFDRLTKYEGGKRIVEDFSVGFPSPGVMRIKSVEKTGEGISTMEIVGRRVASAKSAGTH